MEEQIQLDCEGLQVLALLPLLQKVSLVAPGLQVSLVLLPGGQVGLSVEQESWVGHSVEQKDPRVFPTRIASPCLYLISYSFECLVGCQLG